MHLVFQFSLKFFEILFFLIKTQIKDASNGEIGIVNISDVKHALLNYGDKMDDEDWDMFEKTLKSNRTNKNSDGKISCDGNF